MKLKNLLPGFVFLIIAIMLATLNDTANKPNYFPSMVGKQIPEFSAPLLFREGKLTDAELKNNVILNFWASWCVACQAEHGTLLELAKNHEIYGMNSGDNDDDAKNYLREHGNPFTKVGVDAHRKLAIAFGLQGMPETYVIGKDGVIYFHYRGAINDSIVKTQILPILAELENKK